MYVKMTEDEKKARREARKEAKREVEKLAIVEAEKNQKPVKSITISIEWKKSRMWGSNPHASASVSFQDGTYGNFDGFTCSGCGYCKESTVIAEIFNQFLKYKLYGLKKTDKTPYGIYLRDDYKSYSGGIGTSCYPAISKYIGGNFKTVASGKTFDVFEYTDFS